LVAYIVSLAFNDPVEPVCARRIYDRAIPVASVRLCWAIFIGIYVDRAGKSCGDFGSPPLRGKALCNCRDVDRSLGSPPLPGTMWNFFDVLSSQRLSLQFNRLSAVSCRRVVPTFQQGTMPLVIKGDNSVRAGRHCPR